MPTYYHKDLFSTLVLTDEQYAARTDKNRLQTTPVERPPETPELIHERVVWGFRQSIASAAAQARQRKACKPLEVDGITLDCSERGRATLKARMEARGAPGPAKPRVIRDAQGGKHELNTAAYEQLLSRAAAALAARDVDLADEESDRIGASNATASEQELQALLTAAFLDGRDA